MKNKMNDKLKIIRENAINNNPTSLLCLEATDNQQCLADIQSESYQLGRSEVIEEIEKLLTTEYHLSYEKIIAKLNQLKEK